MSTEENTNEVNEANEVTASTGLWKTYNGGLAYVSSVKDGIAEGVLKDRDGSIPCAWNLNGEKVFIKEGAICLSSGYLDNLWEKVARRSPEVLEVGKTYVGSEGSARYEVVAVGRDISGFSVLSIITGNKNLQPRPILIKEVKSLRGEGWITEGGVWITGEYVEPTKVYVALLKTKNGSVFTVSYSNEDLAISTIKAHYSEYEYELVGSKIVEVRQGKFDFGKEELQNGND